MNKLLSIACTGMAIVLIGILVAPGCTAQANPEVVQLSEVTWEPLNPARGDKSPKAGTLWGDRNGADATGFLVSFVDGFSSPPHIHNVSYRGVVISGLVHNDDPEAADMWMPQGSFWTQPQGEVHITAAKGKTNIAYIEIEEGPYLVLPTEKAFDNGERPINVDASNIVWVNHPRGSGSTGGVHISYLWGKPQENELHGTLLRLPADFAGTVASGGSTFRAVLIQGALQYHVVGGDDSKALEPGSYFGSEGQLTHRLSCESGEECIMYVRTDSPYDVTGDK